MDQNCCKLDFEMFQWQTSSLKEISIPRDGSAGPCARPGSPRRGGRPSACEPCGSGSSVFPKRHLMPCSGGTRAPLQFTASVTCPSATQQTQVVNCPPGFMSHVQRRWLTSGWPCPSRSSGVSPASRRIRADSPWASWAPASQKKASRRTSAIVKRPHRK